MVVTHMYLNEHTGLCGVLTVPQQSVSAFARVVKIETIKGLKVVLPPRAACHLSLKTCVWNCTESGH